MRQNPSLADPRNASRRLARRIVGTTSILLATVGVPATAPASPPAAGAAKSLTILSDTRLPASLLWASDLRWASDHSVYLGAERDGLLEVSLDPAGGVATKEMIPGAAKAGGFGGCHRIASSSLYLVAAGPGLSLTWRSLLNPARTESAFELIAGLDVRENLLAIVGARRDEKGQLGADGAIAWTGSLDKGLRDLTPVAYDVLGPGTPSMNRCSNARLGAVRFLTDGSLLVVPGVQPGIQLYDPKGKLVHVWDSGKLGIDSPCGSLSDEQARHLAADAGKRSAWANRYRSVDAVLPLPQGAGIVIRWVEKGHTLWSLQVLHPDGTVGTWSIPIEGDSEFYNLQGDVRAGKVVFLLHEFVFRGGPRDHPLPPRLIVTRPPLG